jgi:hypothetical protein
LTAPFTYESGLLQLRPLSDSYQPSVGSAVALKKFLDTGPYSEAVRRDTPTEFLASYSHYVGGSPSPEDEPVWVIRYVKVPDVGAGPGDDPVELHDILVLVDSQTGQPLAVYSSVPDSTAMPPPS